MEQHSVKRRPTGSAIQTRARKRQGGTVPDAYRRIWRVVEAIPRGKVSTYGRVGRLAGFPSHARLVGYALHALPNGTDIPWHRVINSSGRISLPVRTGGFDRQRSRLVKEGIQFKRGRVPLKKFLWPAE
jgi:methylated-DNA-protein-cysteine methyltransferase-like protein